MGYQKDSPYAEMFDYHIVQMSYTGVLDYIKTKYSQLQQKCDDFRLVHELVFFLVYGIRLHQESKFLPR